MEHYEAATTIAAAPDDVWRVLVDGDGWSRWDSGVDAVEGRIAPGEKVRIRSRLAPGRAFPVRVSDFEPPHRFAFTGGMPLGLFRGVRTYTLTPADGGTTFRMREEFTGPLLPLVWRSMPDMQGSFDQFAAGLKRRVESGA
ncbi:SRPBCC domain-containing protein [Geodermatophilus sp. YIM 151500]|uniref:SRPBCC domain-containing protein n=1 Tax=Geodermatophilus sp. YIM 151500 TaxID=2984531 RepID=UPI0021E40214|nr:SRPBCC domain-containing protein [Geodermatophilus sp. YIM 151500]MCV2491544.1 SRPBCC domain-containing protein [Geodermatophilus sp. YIM 151500]